MGLNAHVDGSPVTPGITCRETYKKAHYKWAFLQSPNVVAGAGFEPTTFGL
tara:strand:+ start:904 stop:1056 length:153 start_codon:yes stop_codon:yes gene_type:complete